MTELEQKADRDPFSDVVPERVWLDLSNVCEREGMVKLTLTVNGTEKELYHSYVIDGTVCHGFNLTRLIKNAVTAEREACVQACGLCGGIGYDGMPGEEHECCACAPIRARGKQPRASLPEGK